MYKIAFFDTKPYDKEWFDKYAGDDLDITYFETKLLPRSAELSAGFDAVCAFVNDDITESVVNTLCKNGVRLIAMRSAGYSNVDFRAADGKITVVRVPAYSPHAVAEHAAALLLAVNRKIPRAYYRTRDFNFSLIGLTGLDLYGKCAGIIGTGKIGRAFIDICRGFGMKTVAYDLFPAEGSDIDYRSIDELLSVSDVISLHCPLTPETHHLLDAAAFGKMKDGVFIVNTSRGALIDSEALLSALNSEKVRGAGLDVYEEEAEVFYEDRSGTVIGDDVLSLLVSHPNVVITSHQGFFTEEALDSIARTTTENIRDFFAGRELENEVCFRRGKVSEKCN